MRLGSPKLAVTNGEEWETTQCCAHIQANGLRLPGPGLLLTKEMRNIDPKFEQHRKSPELVLSRNIAEDDTGSSRKTS